MTVVEDDDYVRVNQLAQNHSVEDQPPFPDRKRTRRSEGAWQVPSEAAVGKSCAQPSSGHSALSLRSSAMMVGATQLSERTSNLMSALETGCNAVAVKQLTALRKCGNQTAAQLTASYVNAA